MAYIVVMVYVVEDTLIQSNIDVASDLTNSGQMLPLMIGIISVLAVVAGWIDNRLMNKLMRVLSRNTECERGQELVAAPVGL